MADYIGEAKVKISADITPLQQAVEKVKQTTSELKGLEGFKVNWGEGTGSIQEYNEYFKQATDEYARYVDEVKTASVAIERHNKVVKESSQTQQTTAQTSRTLGQRFAELKDRVEELGYKFPAAFFNMKESIEGLNRIGRTFLIGLTTATVAFGKASIDELAKYDVSVANTQEQIERSMSKIKASFGQLVLPITQAVAGISEFLSANQQLVIGIGTTLAVIGGTAGLIALITKLKTAFTLLGSSMLGPVGIIASLIGLVAGLNSQQRDFVETTEEVDKQVEKQKKNMEELAKANKTYASSMEDVNSQIAKIQEQMAEAEWNYKSSLKNILVSHEKTVNELTQQIKDANEDYEKAVAERNASFAVSQAKEAEEHQKKVNELTKQLNFLQRYNNAYNREKLAQVQFALAKENRLYQERTEAEKAELELQNKHDQEARDKKLAQFQSELDDELAFMDKHREKLNTVRGFILDDEVESLERQYLKQQEGYQNQIALANKKGAEAAENFATAYAKYLEQNKEIETEFAKKGASSGEAFSGNLLTNVNNWLRKNSSFFDDLSKKFYNLFSSGIWTSETINWSNGQMVYKPGGSGGGIGRANGGFTGRGGKYETADDIVVHRGEYVLPQEMVDQDKGVPKGLFGGNITINVSGTFATSEAEKRNVALQIANALQQVQKQRLGA